MNENLTREQKIEKVIREGHEIAKKIKNMQSIKELGKFESQINKYMDFVDENFGVIDVSVKLPRKECELTRFLFILISSKLRALYPNNEKTPIFRQSVKDNFNDFEKYLDSQSWVTDAGTSDEFNPVLTNSSLAREQKIAMVKAEGHAIAEKLKKINDIKELDVMNGRVCYFKEYVDSEFGVEKNYEPYFDGKDKSSQLSFELSMIVEEKERQLIYYPDKADIAKKSIEQGFEKYLEYGDWQIERNTEF